MEQVLRRGYRAMAMRYHPDKNPDPKARMIFVRVQRAYERLQGFIKRRLSGGKGDPHDDEDEVSGPR